MTSPKKLIRMAGKWQNLAALREKRNITFPGTTNRTTRGIDKGHFAVYTCDDIRILVPVGYLKNNIFQELLKVAEEEYGLQTDWPIRLPFDDTFMKYVISLIERHVCKDLEKAILMSVINSERCLPNSNIQLEQSHPQVLICSF